MSMSRGTIVVIADAQIRVFVKAGCRIPGWWAVAQRLAIVLRDPSTIPAVFHAAFLKEVAAGRVENCFGWDERTKPEEFNAVMAAGDVIYACYRSFPNSSNVMGKAAAFGKPVIVSGGYLMGERCEEYGLGAVLSEGNVDEIVEAIRHLGGREGREQWEKTGRVDDYVSAHSDDKLDEMFTTLLMEEAGVGAE